MIKQAIKGILTRRCEAAYQQELKAKENVYAHWVRLHREEVKKQIREKGRLGEELTLRMVPYSALRETILSGEDLPDILVACHDEGSLSEQALPLIRQYFAEHPEINLAYGDEDMKGEDGTPCNPWLKSDWAPDTFLSTFYFGNVFALRTSILQFLNPGSRTAQEMEAKATRKEEKRDEERYRENGVDDGVRAWIYGQLCMRIAQAEGGFTKRRGGQYPIGHIREILFHADGPTTPWNSNLIPTSLTGRYNADSAKERLVSIIIPSKDNAAVLRRCLETIDAYTHNAPYEILIVDNGSEEACRREVEAMVEAFNENGTARYLYEPMDFNFSRMCNRAQRRPTAN